MDSLQLRQAEHTAVYVKGLTAVLSLLPQNINQPSTVHHCIGIIRQTINPSQAPVITADQPVYVIAKQIHENSYSSNASWAAHRNVLRVCYRYMSNCQWVNGCACSSWGKHVRSGQCAS